MACNFYIHKLDNLGLDKIQKYSLLTLTLISILQNYDISFTLGNSSKYALHGKKLRPYNMDFLFKK